MGLRIWRGMPQRYVDGCDPRPALAVVSDVHGWSAVWRRPRGTIIRSVPRGGTDV